MNTYKIPFSLCALLFCCVLLVPNPTTHAMVIRGGDTYELEEYTTLEDDLYVAGKVVTLAGTTTGDVFVAGSEVNHSGFTSEDALLAGGEVTITGDIEGDLRVVGGKVVFSGHVTEDLLLIGGTIQITEDAIIEGDLLVVGEHLISEGTVGGMAEIYVRSAEFKGGVVGSSLRAYARESLSVTGTTHILGDVEYKAPNTAMISETVTIDGENKYTAIETSTAKKGTIDVFGLLQLILATIGGAIALVFFFPAQARIMTNKALSGENVVQVMKGFSILIVVPVVALLSMITLIGIVPGMTVLFVYAALVSVALALSPVLVGVLLARWLKKKDEELSLAWVSLGAITFAAISLLPFIGFLIRLLFFLTAFSVVCSMFYDAVWKRRKGADGKGEPNVENHEKEDIAGSKEEITGTES